MDPIPFPAFSLWDKAKSLLEARSLFGRAIIGKLILPVQIRKYKFSIDERINDINNNEEYKKKYNLMLNKFKVVTPDGAQLNTLLIAPKIKSQDYLIYFNANNQFYEEKLNYAQYLIEDLECNVLGFNYRGSGQSTGRVKSKDDLVKDGIAQVQKLLDENVDPEHITLYGHSLGGAIATLVTAHFHKQGKKIYVFNDRSFSTITRVAVGWLRRRSPFLAWLAKPLIKFVLDSTKWEIDAESAYRSIPDSYKEYMVAKSDLVITDEGSLHAALQDEKEETNKELPAMKLAGDTQASTATQLMTGNDFRLNRRIMFADNPKKDTHCLDTDKLKNRFNETASDFFGRFFYQTQILPPPLFADNEEVKVEAKPPQCK